MRPEVGRIEAIVDRLGGSASTCRYAACRPRNPNLFPKKDGKNQDITFSIAPDVWTGDSDPVKGQVVMLSDIRELEKGLRAFRAEPKPIMRQE